MRRVAFGLCLAAGVFYNSWPLGYWLDNQTARHGLASDLEHAGRPFYWLFIAGDILTAVLLITAVAVVSFKRQSRLGQRAWLVLGGLLMFGLFTAVAALLPSQCALTPLFRCGTSGQGLSLDAITSSLAALGLLISLAVLSLARPGPGAPTRLTRVVLAAWTVSGVIFAGLALSNHSARLAQDVFMILCGVAIAVIGLNLETDTPS